MVDGEIKSSLLECSVKCTAWSIYESIYNKVVTIVDYSLLLEPSFFPVLHYSTLPSALWVIPTQYSFLSIPLKTGILLHIPPRALFLLTENLFGTSLAFVCLLLLINYIVKGR